MRALADSMKDHATRAIMLRIGAKRRADNISSFFMANLPSLATSRLPDQGKGIRDDHHNVFT